VCTALTFSIIDRLGVLDDVLRLFREAALNLRHIESRRARDEKMDYDFFAEIEGELPDGFVQQVEALGAVHVRVLQEEGDAATGGIWFPRSMRDLDRFAAQSLAAGAELESDHPGFNDPVYRERRAKIAEVALTYKSGQQIPRIEYTDDEVATWGVIYRKLEKLRGTHACEQYRRVFPLLVEYCGYAEDNIPQLQDIDEFLHGHSGWRIRPVTGLLSSRQFLNALAFRTFFSTQYIRHASMPLYTPEPDVCHELLGHVPLFADPEFCKFSQEIGLASLGASDAFVEQLATCYWFTVEFGLCKEGEGEVKAYGAGLLSSFGELRYALGGDETKPAYEPFDPSVAGVTSYPITKYQPKYFVCSSFASMTQKMRQFSLTSDRPFHVAYDPLTEKVEVLDSPKQLAAMVQRVMDDLSVLTGVLAGQRW
jgi:phenylalanine-4-hydroxylase